MNNLFSKKCAIIGTFSVEEEHHNSNVVLKEELRGEILKLVEEGYLSFYSGLELGSEMWAGEIILELKESFPDLKLIPFLADENRANNWEESDRERYFDCILPNSEPALYVDYQPQADSMLQRDQLMIQRSQVIILVYNGEPMELRMAHDFTYAKDKKCQIIHIDTSKL